MNRYVLAAFSDELEKISEGFMTNVGNRLTSWGRSIGSTPRRTLEAVGDIATSPAGALRHGWNESVGPNVGAVGKAVFFGGTALQAAELARDRDITGRGESRLTRGLRFVGGTLAGTAGMTRGVLPSIVIGAAGDAAGGFIGRRIDKARGYKPKPKSDVPAAMPTKPAVVQQALQD